MDRYFMVMAGGAIGSLLRYSLSAAIMTRIGGRFPLSTMLINISGSFLVGIFMTIFTDRLALNPNWRLLVVVGFLGGYTTFSAFEWETLGLMKDAGPWLAFANVAGSVVLGYAAVWLGASLAARR